MDVYSQDSIEFWEELVCDDVKWTVTCIDWTVGWNTDYWFKVCVKWDLINCEANASYVYNEHTYNIPEINHSETFSWTIQENENNGTFEYILLYWFHIWSPWLS